MTDREFEELAALWAEPDREEQARLEAMARKARRRGRLLAYADFAWFFLIVGGSAFFAFVAPGPLTTAGILLLLVATVWLTWRRRQYRQMAQTLDTADPSSFLLSSKRVARANLRRVTLSMVAFSLLVPLTLFLKMSFRTGGDFAAVPGAMAAWALSPRGLATLAVLVLILAYTERSRRRIEAELRSLEELQRAEEEEARHENGGVP